MADVMRQIITPYANREAAIQLAIREDGVHQCDFTAMATTDPTGGGATPTHCWGNGWMDEAVVQRFVDDPANYVVTSYPNRQGTLALAAHVPPLYAWLGTI